MMLKMNWNYCNVQCKMQSVTNLYDISFVVTFAYYGDEGVFLSIYDSDYYVITRNMLHSIFNVFLAFIHLLERGGGNFHSMRLPPQAWHTLAFRVSQLSPWYPKVFIMLWHHTIHLVYIFIIAHSEAWYRYFSLSFLWVWLKLLMPYHETWVLVS
jgi:hypothetical protein